MATTIPAKYYVTIQYRKDATEGLLGFASPYTKDSAFEKRKSTQDNWAYGISAKFTIQDDDSIEGTFSDSGKFDAAMLFAANCYPRIIDNTPIEGFEIAKSVRRYGWGGSGNVVWRIADPRGFELEISSENLARLLDCSVIENGVIKGKCCWGRDGARNILLPEVSEPYQEAFAKTAKIANKVSLKDIKPGDTVELLNRGYDTDAAMYLGSYKLVSPSYNYDEASRHAGRKLAGEVKDRYLFKKKDGEIFAISTPKVAALVEQGDGTFDREVFALEFNKNVTEVGNHDAVIFISTTKVDLDKFTFELVESDFQLQQYFPNSGLYYLRPILTRYNGKLWVGQNKRDRYDPALQRYVGDPTLREVSEHDLVSNGVLKSVTVKQKSTSWYSSYYDTANDIDFPQNERLQFYDIVLNYNGSKFNVTYIGSF